MTSPLIDSYQHIGLPRFRSAEDGLAINEAAGITKAIVCPFETCPDLAEVHRAFCIAPRDLRIFGLALGADQTEVDAGVHAQLDAGFEGVRLEVERITQYPDTLDVLGRRGGVPLVVGMDALAAEAARLVGFLDRYPDGIMISPHCAGPTDPAVFDRNGAVRALYSHPRFYVVLSRFMMHAPRLVEAWVGALIDLMGWQNLLWGSEMPVSHWRDETITVATQWIDRFGPTPRQKRAFLHDNAERAVFGRPPREPAALRLPYDPFAFEHKIGAPFFPFGFAADTRVPARLVAAWQRGGGDDTEPFSAFVNRVLFDSLDGLDSDRPAATA